MDTGVVEVGVTMVAGGCFWDARRGHVNEEGQSMRQCTAQVAYWRDTPGHRKVCSCSANVVGPAWKQLNYATSHRFATWNSTKQSTSQDHPLALSASSAAAAACAGGGGKAWFSFNFFLKN